LLDVALTADGNVHQITLLRSSGSAVLDEAAVRIVELAAPFAPFPAAIKEETEILHIVRTWRFGQDSRLSSTR
jgi:protein TonB